MLYPLKQPGDVIFTYEFTASIDYSFHDHGLRKQRFLTLVSPVAPLAAHGARAKLRSTNHLAIEIENGNK
jgi:hypothetical protein